MVRKNSQTNKKETKKGSDNKGKITFKQKVLGTIGLGTLGVILHNRKEVKIERTQKEIELYELEKKLPWHRKHKFLTYLGAGVLAYSLVACPGDYKKATISFGEHIYQAVERGSSMIEEKRTNEYEARVREITEKAKEAVQESKKLYINIKEEKTKLESTNYDLLKKLEKKEQEETSKKNLQKNKGTSETFSIKVTGSRSSNRNLEHVISRDDYIKLVVQRGDSISALASKIYNGGLNADFYDRLGDYNGISNENLIYPGQVLKFPKDTSVLYN